MGLDNSSGWWCAYVRKVLRRFGYERCIEEIIDLILVFLSALGFDSKTAEKNLANRRFKGSREQIQTARAIRCVLYLDEAGDGTGKRRGRDKLLEHDPSAQEIEDDPALRMHKEDLEAGVIPALESLRPRDRKILWAIVVQEMTYREAAEALRIPQSSLHARVQQLLPILALQIVQSRNKNKQ